MRADMFKVIVERPRWASRFGDSPKLRKTDKAVLRIGHKRQVAEVAKIGKSLNENLAPLRRYLMKQRGRKWDKVYSEICEHLDTGSTVKMHVREHIDDFIMVKVHVDADGNWFGQGRWHGLHPVSEWWWQELYVDPNDGLIKETAKLRRKLGVERKRYNRVWLGEYDQGPHDDFRRMEPDRALIRRKGIWFEVRLDRDPGCDEDRLRHELLVEAWRQHERWAVRSMKQLSKKELKANGLENLVDKG